MPVGVRLVVGQVVAGLQGRADAMGGLRWVEVWVWAERIAGVLDGVGLPERRRQPGVAGVWVARAPAPAAAPRLCQPLLPLLLPRPRHRLFCCSIGAAAAAARQSGGRPCRTSPSITTAAVTALRTFWLIRAPPTPPPCLRVLLLLLLHATARLGTARRLQAHGTQDAVCREAALCAALAHPRPAALRLLRASDPFAPPARSPVHNGAAAPHHSSVAGAPVAVVANGQGRLQGLLPAHHVLDPIRWVAGVRARGVLARLQHPPVAPARQGSRGGGARAGVHVTQRHTAMRGTYTYGGRAPKWVGCALGRSVMRAFDDDAQPTCSPKCLWRR